MSENAKDDLEEDADCGEHAEDSMTIRDFDLPYTLSWIFSHG